MDHIKHGLSCFLLLCIVLLFAPAVQGSQGMDFSEEQEQDAAAFSEERARERDDTGSVPEFTEFSELSGRTVSMLTGAPFEELVKSFVPDVGEVTYYASMSDMLLALKAGKTDAIVNNNAVGALAVNRYRDLALFPHSLKGGVFGYGFAKGDPRREEWQKALDQIPQETVDGLWEKWTGMDESVKHVPAQDWPGRNGTVKVVMCDTLEPISYVGENGELAGLESFCSRRMMGPKAARNTILAAEEFTGSRILPALDREKRGGVRLAISSDEGGGARLLQIDCTQLPGGKEPLSEGTEEISSAILGSILQRLPEEEKDGTLCYRML